jgi:hypothetical protein
MILICGDSWSCGEWENMSVTHRGLAGYISEETSHQVINLGMPGSSNLDTIRVIQHFLNLNPSILIEKIIVFQTDYIRGVIPNDVGKDGYTQFKAKRISQFYYSLSDLYKKHNTPVHVIGGLSDTLWLSKFSQIYQGVNIACQSFTNLLVNNCDRISTPVHGMYEQIHETLINKVKSQSSQDEIIELINNIELGLQRSILFHNHNKLFYPDGSHPNRHGHRVLFDFLCKNKILT